MTEERIPDIAIPFPVYKNACGISPWYLNSVLYSGANPVLIPITSPKADTSLLSRFDGLLLPGGGDVEPELYGKARDALCGEADRVRDEYELSAARYFYERDLPVLAICRGIQVLNVALGGTLRQHIENHVQTLPRVQPSHKVIIDKSSPLYFSDTGIEVSVNSFHHQALDDVSDRLKICAKSAPDGIVEGVYSPDRKYCVGVQWHPECMFFSSVLSKRLFKAFTDACVR